MPLVFGRTATGLMIPVQVDANGKIVIYDSIAAGLSIPAGSNLIGKVDVNNAITIGSELPAGSKQIGSIQARAHAYIGGAWQKNPLMFGYSDSILGSTGSTNLSAGTNIFYSGSVPAGEIWVITNLAMYYGGTVTNVVISLLLNRSSTGYTLWQQRSITSNQNYDRQGYWIMKQADRIQFQIANATAGDDAFMYWAGFRMDIDL